MPDEQLRLDQGADVQLVCDRRESGTWIFNGAEPPVPVATLFRIGYLDEKNRIWAKVPADPKFDGGRLTPLYVDARTSYSSILKVPVVAPDSSDLSVPSDSSPSSA
jgi:glutathionyl-hydroquinone reductase